MVKQGKQLLGYFQDSRKIFVKKEKKEFIDSSLVERQGQEFILDSRKSFENQDGKSLIRHEHESDGG